MVFGVATKTGSRLFSKSDLLNSSIRKERLSFNAAVLMSLIGLGLSLFSTNQMLMASSASSTRSILNESK